MVALVLVGLAAAAYAVLGSTGASAASFVEGDPSGVTLAAAPSTSPGPQGAGPAWMGPGGMRMGAFRGGITITAISGSKLSLQTADGWTRTIDATGATVTRAGQTVGLGGLKVGDQIAFRETRQSDGSFKITEIAVVLPHVSGTLTKVDASSLTVSQPDGTSKTVLLTASTTYKQAGNSATKSALVVGSRVEIEGTTASNGTFTAASVEIMPAMIAGTVSSKTGDSIAVKKTDGSTITIRVSSSTRYQVRGVSNPSLASVAVGDRIVAEGSLNADGSLAATAVRAGVSAAGMPGFGPGMGHGFGRGMGHGWGGFGGPGNAPNPSAAPSAAGSSTSANL